SKKPIACSSSTSIRYWFSPRATVWSPRTCSFASPGRMIVVEGPLRVVRRGAKGTFNHNHRSEEHTSELQYGSISYAVFCLYKKKSIKSTLSTHGVFFKHNARAIQPTLARYIRTNAPALTGEFTI